MRTPTIATIRVRTPGRVEACTINQPAVAVRATPDAEASAPSIVGSAMPRSSVGVRTTSGGGVRRPVRAAGTGAFISAGAICFATAVGAFGTAFTLAAKINVLPMVIYTEFTLSANIAMAAALSFVLGIVTWLVLALARTAAGSSVAAAG